VIHEPRFLLLVEGGILYFILGDIAESVMLMGFFILIIGITVYQEQKTERALEALMHLSSPRALVIRDGVQQCIAGSEVFTGGLVILSECNQKFTGPFCNTPDQKISKFFISVVF
jgi:Ca2+-transporting ATPase